MRFTTGMLSSAALGLALAAGAYADTRNSEDKTKMEQKASPAAPKSDEERAEASQGQPGVPHRSGDATRRDTAQGDRKAAKTPDKASSSAGSSAPGAGSDKEQVFKRLDLDGDGSVSKAEAAGNAKIMNAFDGADKDSDGKLSRAEYDALGKPEAKAKTKTSQRAKAQAK